MAHMLWMVFPVLSPEASYIQTTKKALQIYFNTFQEMQWITLYPKGFLYSLHLYNLLILRISLSDISFLSPIGTEETGTVSSLDTDPKAVLEKQKWSKIK